MPAKEKAMPHRGLMFFILYCASACMSLSQFKIVPLLGQLTESLGITYAETSWMMSVFTVAAIVLAIPIGGIVTKVGPKKSYIVVLVIMIVGNVIGAFGIDNYGVLLFSRILEGCAFAIWNVAGIVLIGMWYPGKNNGLFIGIFMTFVAIASFIALNTAVPISNALGETSLWWIVAGLTLVFTALFAIFVKEAPKEAEPAKDEQQANPQPASAEKPNLLDVFKNGKVMAICVSQLVIGFVLYFFLNNYPSLFTGCYGLDPTTANFYGSLNGLWGIPFCILGGFILDKLGEGNIPKFVIAIYVALAGACLATNLLNPSVFILHTLLTGALPGLVLTANNFLVPRCVNRPQNIGYGLAVLSLFYNIGIFIGNPIIMYAVGSTGSWAYASYILTAMAVLGLVATVAFMLFSKGKKAA